MPAPRKYDAETQERAVWMYQDQIAEHGGSKTVSRRHVGELLDIAPATLRNWIETAERKDSPRVSTTASDADLDEVRRLRKENVIVRLIGISPCRRNCCEPLVSTQSDTQGCRRGGTGCLTRRTTLE